MKATATRGQADAKVGLALAGGGAQGAIYEIGALRALDEALEGIDFNDLHVYVGVSAGAFISANLANNLTTAQMCRAIVKQAPGEHPFSPETFLSPALGKFLRRGLRIPKLFFQGLQRYLENPQDRGLLDSLTRLSQALPVGMFDNEPVRAYLERIYNIKGRSDDFRKLDKHLVIVATDLDSGEAVRFGESGFDQVPISSAVQASSALPGLYTPVEIDGRCYVDGVLIKTLHGSVAIDAGADLLICLNPLVPVNTDQANKAGVMRGGLAERGLLSVLSQTFRAMIHSRLETGLSRYGMEFEDVDVVLIEPPRDDYQMFYANVFSFGDRQRTCNRAYRQTRRYLRERQEELVPIFQRHGIRLRTEILKDEERSVWQGVNVNPEALASRPDKVATTEELNGILDRLEASLDALIA